LLASFATASSSELKLHRIRCENDRLDIRAN
jgi:hypothetical protein